MSRYWIIFILIILNSLYIRIGDVLALGEYQKLKNDAEYVLQGRIISTSYDEEYQKCRVNMGLDVVLRDNGIESIKANNVLDIYTGCYYDPLLSPIGVVDLYKLIEGERIRVYVNFKDNRYDVVEDGLIFLDITKRNNIEIEDVTEFVGLSNLPFRDIDIYDKNYNAIYTLWFLGIIDGYKDKTFRPNGLMTRAEVLKVLIESNILNNKIDGLKYDDEIVFDDVGLSDWFYKYILYAYNNNWVNGYDVGGDRKKFRPDRYISKAEALKLILESMDMDIKEEAQYTTNYIDIDGWYKKYIIYAENLGLLDEKDIYFHPDLYAERRWITEIMYRLYLLNLPVIEDEKKEEEEEIIEDKNIDDLSILADPKKYTFIDTGKGSCTIKAIIDPDERYIVWNNNLLDKSSLLVAEDGGDNIEEVLAIKDITFRSNPSTYIPYRFSSDLKSVYVYKQKCGFTDYRLFNYFADELLKIDLETKEIIFRLKINNNNGFDGKFLDISLDDNKIAYFYTDNSSGYEPFKTWIKILDFKEMKEISFDMPFYTSKDQQFGEGYFSPQNDKIAYMLSSGGLPGEEVFKIIILYIDGRVSKEVVSSTESWNGEWYLAGWKDNETIIINTTNYINGEIINNKQEIPIN